MPKRSDALLIKDILENMEAVFEFVGDSSFEAFMSDRQKMYAVERAFEIIGEAARAVSETTQAAYPLVEWRLMTDFRNLLIHQYFGIDYAILWSVIKGPLPFNQEMLQRIDISE